MRSEAEFMNNPSAFTSYAHWLLSHGKSRSCSSRFATAVRFSCAFALGSVSAAGFAPWSVWPVALISLVFFLHWLQSAQPRGALLSGWAFGLGLGLFSLRWLVDAFNFQESMPSSLGWLALILLAGYTATYWGAASFIAVSLSKGRPLRFAISFAAAFVLGEWLRGLLMSGFPWNPLGAIWVPVPPALSAAETVGALGLSGATSLGAGLVAAGFRGSRASVIVLVALIMAVFSVGMLSAPSADTDQPITIVQANIGQSDKWRSGAAKRQIDLHVSLSSKLSQSPYASRRIVFWPEAAVTLPIDFNAALRRQMTRELAPGELLVTGAIGHGKAGATNSAFVLDSDGRIRARYDKRHLVPFGEYLPLAGFLSRLGLTRLVPGSVGFEAGQGSPTVLTERHKVGIAICYEIAFPTRVVDQNARPEFIFNPSNDAWFGNIGPPQHLAQARLRAVEQGLPVVRATPTGISAVIRADGSIAAGLPIGYRGRLDAFLPSAKPATPFARWGDRIPLTLALLGLLFVVSPAPLRRGW